MRIAVLGAGGHGKVVADAALAIQGISVVGFLDDDPALAGRTFLGLPMLGAISLWQELDIDAIVPAIGDNRARRAVVIRERARNATVATIVHPAAVVSRRASVGIGTAVLAGAIINADAQVGENVIVNTGAIVEHDCVASDSHVHIAPGCCLGRCPRRRRQLPGNWLPHSSRPQCRTMVCRGGGSRSHQGYQGQHHRGRRTGQDR